jgi:hypothetical protein
MGRRIAGRGNPVTVRAPRASATAPTPTVGCFDITVFNATFAVKSPDSIMRRNIPNVSMA